MKNTYAIRVVEFPMRINFVVNSFFLICTNKKDISSKRGLSTFGAVLASLLSVIVKYL